MAVASALYMSLAPLPEAQTSGRALYMMYPNKYITSSHAQESTNSLHVTDITVRPEHAACSMQCFKHDASLDHTALEAGTGSSVAGTLWRTDNIQSYACAC